MGDAALKFVLALCALAAAVVPGQAGAQAPKPAAAEPMGRLFFTPAQRAQLDVARTQRARATLSTERTEELQTAAPAPQTITYDGVVRRGDGKSTVFINSRPVTEKEASSGPVIVGRVRADGGVSLQIPQSGRAVELKPGQSIELLSGAIEERYARKPAAPEARPAAPESKPEPKPATKAVPEARGAKPSATEAARAEREREELEQRRVDDAVTRALQEKAGARPEAATTAPAEPRR
jgi:hypothetical protein